MLARSFLKADRRLAQVVPLKKDLELKKKDDKKLKALQKAAEDLAKAAAKAAEEAKANKNLASQQKNFMNYFNRSTVNKAAFGPDRDEPDPKDINPKKRPLDNEDDRNDTTPNPPPSPNRKSRSKVKSTKKHAPPQKSPGRFRDGVFFPSKKKE